MNLKAIQQLTVVQLCFAISFFTSGIILNIIQGSLYFTLRRFNKYLYRKINYYLAYSFYSQLVFMAEWWSESETAVYIDKTEFEKYYGKEHGLLLMNHSYEIDWLMGWKFCDGIGVLGNCKAFAKKSIQYMPPVGWSWKFGEYVFLERSYDKDKEIILKQLQELGNYPDPIWLLIFPEGTRFSPEKHEASQKFAEKNGLPILKHHLTPRTKGFTTSLMGMKGKINAIYDINIAFNKDDKVAPTMTNLLYGKKVLCHLHIRRIPIEDVPETEAEASKWLHDLYIVKDKMQESFLKTGDFFTTSGVKRIQPFELPRRMYSFVNTIFWNIIILVPALRYILGLLFSGELLYFSIAIGICSAFYIMLKLLIGMSQISKASSYGTEKKKA
ncbi:1-acyl-sn-glycerol-3-phosphate acyltransferase gamma-like [Arctopsyche grandis]|uniref:1-acyl-sn-glycerol-3-phosphate acyltransferase gamma-like n=1 Tax=Arctopsyche grandis TaxID=121162 RepID=UPI00406D6FC0